MSIFFLTSGYSFASNCRFTERFGGGGERETGMVSPSGKIKCYRSVGVLSCGYLWMWSVCRLVLSLSFFLSLSLYLSLSLSLSLSLRYLQMWSVCRLVLSPSFSFFLSLSLTRAHTHTRSLALVLSLSFSQIHSDTKCAQVPVYIPRYKFKCNQGFNFT